MWIAGGWSPSGKSFRFRFLRFHITEDLTWTHHTNGKRRHLNFYQEYNRGSAQNISRADLPSMEELWTAGTSPDGSKQMTLRLFQLLPSGPQGPAWGPDHHTQEHFYSTTEKSICVTLAHLFTNIYLFIQLSGRFYRVSWVMMVATMS